VPGADKGFFLIFVPLSTLLQREGVSIETKLLSFLPSDWTQTKLQIASSGKKIQIECDDVMMYECTNPINKNANYALSINAS
jgi:hypothetical protein